MTQFNYIINWREFLRADFGNGVNGKITQVRLYTNTVDTHGQSPWNSALRVYWRGNHTVRIWRVKDKTVLERHIVPEISPLPENELEFPS
jgi:hypothetical protein